MIEQTGSVPSKKRLIEQVTGVNPAMQTGEMLAESEELTLDSHGIVQVEGIDRSDTLGDSRALQVESDYQGSSDPFERDDLTVQRACDRFRRGTSLTDVLILGPQEGIVKGRRSLLRLVREIAGA